MRFTARISGGAGGGPTIEVKDNGIARTPVAAPETAFTLGVGEHLLEVRVTRGGVATGWAPWTIAVDPPADPLKDSDGDGVPDTIEAAAGLDALVQDAGFDGDGDGWSNFDEVLRGCPAVDATNIMAFQYPTCSCVFDGSVIACVPLDTDGDGWSDWDEDVRQTADTDADVYPAARSLYEPELTVTSQPFVAVGVPQNGFGALEVVDVHGRVLPVRTGAGEELTGAVNRAPDELHLPLSFAVPAWVRVPGDLPFVLRMRTWEAPAGASSRARSRRRRWSPRWRRSPRWTRRGRWQRSGRPTPTSRTSARRSRRCSPSA